MKSLFLGLAVLACGSMYTSTAATVQFDTIGSGLCTGNSQCNTYSVTFGNLQLTYVPNTTGDLMVNPVSSPTFGNLVLSCLDTSCLPSSPTTPLPSPLTLYLVFNQTLPIAGTGTITSSSITGSVSLFQGLATINWTNPSVTIQGITYTVPNNPLNITTADNGQTAQDLPTGVTTIQGRVTDNTVPEPSTYAMIGGALLGLGYLRRRKA